MRVEPMTAVGEKALIEQSRAIPASKKFIIFNTCHSGELSHSLSVEPQIESKNPDQNLTYAILEQGTSDANLLALPSWRKIR